MDTSQKPADGTAVNVCQDRRIHLWNNDRDTETLRDDRGRVADTKSWGHSHLSRRC